MQKRRKANSGFLFNLRVYELFRLRDLAVLDFMEYDGSKYLTNPLLNSIISGKAPLRKTLATQCLQIEKIRVAYELIINESQKITSPKLIFQRPHIFDENLSQKTKNVYAAGILRWARFCKENV